MIIRFIRSAVWVVVVVICAALYAMGEAASGQTTNGVVVAGASEAAAPAAPAKKPKNTFALSRTRINFGKVKAGTKSASQSVTSTNKSQVVMPVPALKMTGKAFILSNGCTSAIPPTGTCSASVMFEPPSRGLKDGALAFSDKAVKGVKKVRLIGLGLRNPSPTPTRTPTRTKTPTPTNRLRGATWAGQAHATRMRISTASM